ncbi:MAG: hypothetical protein E8D43_14160 [Nitrospira sp.]|nr:MAG: hypothetical protein E8D43_14160 [Nitrospira sp.]
MLVLDGFGIGALPDADVYGDAGCNTLQRLAAISKGLALPNFEQLGLGHLGQFQGIRPMVQPGAAVSLELEYSSIAAAGERIICVDRCDVEISRDRIAGSAETGGELCSGRAGR